MKDEKLFHELSFYSLSHKGEEFIHQHVVDAYTAQTADASTKLIAIYFALIGLYLLVEKNYTGKQVQNAHVTLSYQSKNFKPISLPEYRGETHIEDILNSLPGKQRDEMIYQWCKSVWGAYKEVSKEIEEMAGRFI